MNTGPCFLDDCENKVCAEAIIPYPPGIPLALPGEVLSKQIIQELKAIKKRKIEVHGVTDRTLRTILVKLTTK